MSSVSPDRQTLFVGHFVSYLVCAAKVLLLRAAAEHMHLHHMYAYHSTHKHVMSVIHAVGHALKFIPETSKSHGLEVVVSTGCFNALGRQTTAAHSTPTRAEAYSDTRDWPNI